MTGETRVLRARIRLLAKPPPSRAGDRGARLAGLRQLLGWLAPVAAAFAALAVAAGAAFRDRSTVSVYPGDGSSPDELVRCADGAMYRDKQQGAMPEAGAEATDEEARGVN